MKQCLKAGPQINLVDNDGCNALTHCMLNKNKQFTRLIPLICPAGETIDETKVEFPDFLKPPEFSLKHLVRDAIRKHLINIDPHENMFGRIPQLGLPSLVTCCSIHL